MVHSLFEIPKLFQLEGKFSEHQIAEIRQNLIKLEIISSEYVSIHLLLKNSRSTCNKLAEHWCGISALNYLTRMSLSILAGNLFIHISNSKWPTESWWCLAKLFLTLGIQRSLYKRTSSTPGLQVFTCTGELVNRTVVATISKVACRFALHNTLAVQNNYTQ